MKKAQTPEIPSGVLVFSNTHLMWDLPTGAVHQEPQCLAVNTGLLRQNPFMNYRLADDKLAFCKLFTAEPHNERLHGG